MGTRLVTGVNKSCGCNRTPQKTKKYRSHKLYAVWKAMKARCANKNHRSYKNYGKRGICVCDEWAKSFISFYNWALSNGYKDGLTIDRHPNNDGDYEPNNCRWTTYKENGRKTRRLKINYDSANEIRLSNLKTSELAKKYHVNKTTILDIKNGVTWQ